MPLRPIPPAGRESIHRAATLLGVTGPYALRFQAQQQAALELLQARKLGVADQLLEQVLFERMHASLAAVLRQLQPVPAATAVALPDPGAGLERRLALFLQAESEGLPVPPDRGACRD